MRGEGTDGVEEELQREVTGAHVKGQAEMTATGSLHSSFPLFSSILTSPSVTVNLQI